MERRRAVREIWSCSLTVITRQPALRSLRSFLASLRRLASIFRSHHALFRFGALKHLGHPCQKHPWTNMTARSSGSTKSGVPGIPLRFDL